MKRVEIIAETHTHQGVALERGAVITVSETIARWLVHMRIGRVLP